MSKQKMRVDEACEVLIALGCGEDPVNVVGKGTNFAEGEETTIAELAEFQFLLSPHVALKSAYQINAGEVKVWFWSGRRHCAGTLLDVVVDRLRMYSDLSRCIKIPRLLKTVREPKPAIRQTVRLSPSQHRAAASV